MADRIYPTNTNTELGSEIEFKGLDWDDIALKIASDDSANQRKAKEASIKDLLAKYAEDSNGLPSDPSDYTEAELRSEFKGKVDDDVLTSYIESHSGDFKKDSAPELHEDDESDTKESAKKNDNKKFWFKNKKDEKAEEEEEEFHQEKNKPKKKIKFTSASEINADALLKAEKSGDLVLRDTILAARRDKRVAIAKSILNTMEKEAVKTASQSKPATTKVASKKVEDNPQAEFKSPKDLSAKQKDIFMQKAAALGFPEEYVLSMFQEGSLDNELLGDAKEIFASNLSTGTKQAAIEALVKAAEYPITKETKNRLHEYWKDEADYDPDGSDWLEELLSEHK